jgi:nitroimidazol reductase NimA-like FMN-containing flavoprotein (pyridoxamine 5'-phosphate oxidase superfamily)
MTDLAETFPVTALNKVKRLHERGRYDREAVYAVLDAAVLCHVAYVIDGQPFCTPTSFWRDGDWLYWHGSAASRMLRNLEDGVPVCLTVAHLDGLVLARCGFNHSANYRSVMCFGTAKLLTDPEEKAQALRDVVDRFYPGRSAELRPDSKQEIKATSVIAMRIAQASVKIRAKGVGDNPEDISFPAWAGVIPIRQEIGADEPCQHNQIGLPRPASLNPLRAGRRLDEALIEAQRNYETLRS